ncbi:hypothetical protein INS49_002718 [Diaporthe citri]|uniref:uncharacterized protein n=1 Tax=Diaporthe citri TaxID=83186 RepID=UPI001C7F142A|nr:uncharacterized protein INS49_002718 [Diaporthe citri]KAG6368509.1 hypothetical protein INS49_002718 [Diaporthe citri]
MSTYSQLVEHMLAQYCPVRVPASASPHHRARNPARRNVLGLDRPTDNAMLWLATLVVKGADQDMFGRAKMSAWVDSISDSVKSVGSDIEWQRLDSGEHSQDPLGC